MSKEHMEQFNTALHALIDAILAEDKTRATGEAIVLGSQLYGQIDRCADALERLAAAQEGRLEVERAKLGQMAKALNPEPQRPAILRAAPPPPTRG